MQAVADDDGWCWELAGVEGELAHHEEGGEVEEGAEAQLVERHNPRSRDVPAAESCAQPQGMGRDEGGGGAGADLRAELARPAAVRPNTRGAHWTNTLYCGHTACRKTAAGPGWRRRREGGRKREEGEELDLDDADEEDAEAREEADALPVDALAPLHPLRRQQHAPCQRCPRQQHSPPGSGPSGQ